MEMWFWREDFEDGRMLTEECQGGCLEPKHPLKTRAWVLEKLYVDVVQNHC